MNRTAVGVIVGGLLGLVDGLSAWSYPEARPILTAIVIGSTVKGVFTGLAAGLIARRWHSLPWGIAAGVAVGFVLSTLAALGQPSHYWAIVLPGMLVGAIVGAVTQRYPARATNMTGARILLWVLMPILAAVATASAAQSGSANTNELSQFLGRDELEEVFELAEPGKGFEVYSRSRMKRVP